MMEVRVYHNGDDAFVSWKPQGKIEGCRGFALLRRRNGVEEAVSTWVGFRGQKHQEGERRTSTSWPIQKYQWSDYMANPGDKLQYRVVPMVGPDKDSLRADSANASDWNWTPEIELSHAVAKNIETYFNRGIVAAQWVSRRLGDHPHEPSDREARRGCRHTRRPHARVPLWALGQAPVRAARLGCQGEARYLRRALRARRRAA